LPSQVKEKFEFRYPYNEISFHYWPVWSVWKKRG